MSSGNESVAGRAASRTRIVRELVLAVVLGVAVLATFAPVVRNGFVDFDDRPNLVQNRWVHQGFTLEALRWALTSTEFENWHPLTWLSHTLDFSLFGPWAGGHHAMSALIHAANVLLLFGVLHAMTGALWRSALVAAVFGLHPLRVESVAWAAERKDVLTLLFGLLALGAYLRYARRRTVGTYAAAVGLYAAALMSKAMLVTFPAILLLLDFWPLNRLSRVRGVPLLPGRRQLLEKIPFLTLAAGASLIAFIAQDTGGAVGDAMQFPMRQRIGNALCSYVDYLGKLLWPAKLAVFYPYFWEDVPWWKPVFGAVFIVAVATVALRSLRRRPAWFVGWAWYLVALLPVIGIVQVGAHTMADRYTYFPQIGVLLMICWGLGDLARGRPRVKAAILAAAPVVLAALAAVTWAQIGHWRTNTILFTHAMRVTEKNYLAYSILGAELIEQGREAEGKELYARALKLAPVLPEAVFDLSGDDYARRGMAREAAEQYRKALAIAPGKRVILAKLRALGDAANDPATPLSPIPDLAHASLDPYQRGNLLARSGRREEAVVAYREAIRLTPGNVEAWHNLGCALGDLGRVDEAIAALEEALRLKPDHPTARTNLEVIGGSRR